MLKNSRTFIAIVSLALLAGCSSGTISSEQESVAVSISESIPVSESSSASETLTMEKLVISQNPDKMIYVEGEVFDSTGMKVNAIMSDGSVKENVSYTIDEAGLELKPSQKYVTVSCDLLFIRLAIKVRYKGNVDTYSVSQTPELETRPLEGKTFFFLGSSVTFGANSEGESMAEFIAKRQRATSIKRAVSGTTLRDIDSTGEANELEDKSLEGKSYVYRLNQYLESEEKADDVDAFVLQLSTNDATSDASLVGEVTGENEFDKTAFDAKTTFGAMETILATVKETWDCPVLLWSNPKLAGNKNTYYKKIVEESKTLAEKWNIGFLNMYENEELNNMSAEDKSFYIPDTIHPTKAGYRDKWTPLFEGALTSLLAD